MQVNDEDLRQLLLLLTQATQVVERIMGKAPASKPPNILCPRCSSPMARRVRKSYQVVFYGCTMYPNCKGTLPVVNDDLTPKREVPPGT
jgi:ssDNA-binding Zn-finger/Zn-ribbon topoisomerase 1